MNIKTVSEAVDFLEKMKKEGKKNSTLEIYKYFLQKKLNVKIPFKVKKQFQLDNIPSESEVKEILERLKTQNYSLYLITKFLTITGCRISEALNIRYPQDIEIQKDKVKIRIIGKGQKERYVFLSVEDFKEIETHFHKDDWIKVEPFLFVNQNGKKFDRCFVSRRLIQISKRYIGKRISAHKLRHFFATSTLKETKDLSAVSRYLGHSNIQTTAQYYIHTFLDIEKIKNALRCVFI